MKHDRTRDLAELIGSAEPQADPIPGIISTADLADLIGISIRNVDMLATRGVFEKIGPGRFNTRAALAAYATYARRRTNGELESQKLRLVQEQADSQAMKNEAARGGLLNADEVQRVWLSIMMDVRAAMLAIPSRMPALDRADAAALDREIRVALVGLADG